MADLGSRKEQILRAVIVEYVDAVEPVASDRIAKKYELGVRSATVRNEMAEITELGYLEQPHTSAGRVPSDRGYRYYVDRLVVRQVVSPEAKQRVLQATDDQDATTELLRETTKALSRLTHLLSAATAVRNSDEVLRTAVITAIGPDRALLVAVLNNGHVENRILEIPAGLTLDTLGQANQLLGAQVQGRSLRQLQRFKPNLTSHPGLDALLTKAAAQVRSVARDLMRGRLITDGEEYMLAQPEFQQEHAEAVLRSLEDEEGLQQALLSTAESSDGITIGGENEDENLREFAILRRRFYVGEQDAGMIAIVGPKRMHYDQNIVLLSFAAQAISETLTRMLKG